MTRRRRGPHQADSPSVSLEIAEAAADLEAVIGEELRSDSAVVDAFGDADEGEGREAVRLVDRELQAKRLEALLEGIGLLPMTCVAGVEPFLEVEAECFVKSEDHVDRCGVMIDPLASEVSPDEIQIEIPALDRCASRGQHLACAFGKRNRRETRWARETLLRAGVHCVDAQAIDVDRYTSERGDGVDEKQRAAKAARLEPLVEAALERKVRKVPKIPEGYSVPAVAKEIFKQMGGDELLEQVATESALGGGGLRDKMPREKAPKD